ncbi:hypothetical protein SK854_32805 [Lentzea sp. BCCO 10_0061]|uniref:Uncharacterized protein n=1 Tax=Lentzea sokolovensis TaxID=3095429 RepID=A0ABU4V572_9PSEU|nr:hypothetical protein [Lentzea sp. BCCO 10_0061]MDX8146935.1 hypothetical protein [Lentzea sp. BCCO 10_0061]
MNGPEHYAAAERLLDSATAADVEAGESGQVSNLAAAQVHATLALAAATALTWSSKDLKAWQAVAGVSSKDG